MNEIEAQNKEKNSNNILPPKEVKSKYCLDPDDYKVSSAGKFDDILKGSDERLNWNRKPIKIREPSYPKGAAKDKVQGYVIASGIIDEQGCYINIEIVESQPKGVFDASMIDALKMWRYPIPTLNNKPVKVKNSIRFDFQLGKNRLNN